MTDRKPIGLSDTVVEVLTMMAAGNPGAIGVLVDLTKGDDPLNLMRVMSLDDMNIRGSQIWVGYKDHCGSDIDVFKKAIDDRDQGMLDTINHECYHPEMEHADYGHKAVKSGASFDHVADQDPEHRGMRL
jgi:hypothetical protein